MTPYTRAMPAHKGNPQHITVLQPAPLKCVFTQTQHPRPSMPVRKSNSHPIAVVQLSPLKRLLKLQRINRTTVVVACIPDFAACIIDGRQGWTATVISFHIMII